MGKKGMMRAREGGFTLLELLASLALLSVAAVALVQTVEGTLQSTLLLERRRRESAKLWNRVQELRASPAAGATLQILPGARPLYRSVLADPLDPEGPGWEVLRAER